MGLARAAAVDVNGCDLAGGVGDLGPPAVVDAQVEGEARVVGGDAFGLTQLTQDAMR